MNEEPVARHHRSRALRRGRIAPLAVAGALLASGCAAGQVAQTANQKPSLDGVNASVRQIDLRALAVQSPGTGVPAYPVGSDAALKVVIVNNATTNDSLTSIRTSVARGWSKFADYNDAFKVQQASLGEATGSPSSAPSSDEPSSDEPASDQPPPTDSPTSSDSRSADASGAPGTGGRSVGTRSSASSSESSSAPVAPLPTGTQSAVIDAGARTSFGTPEATGAILLLDLRQKLFPGSTVRITFTFAQAGTITVSVPVQLGDLARGPEVGEGDDGGE